MKNIIKFLLLLPLAGIVSSHQLTNTEREKDVQSPYFYYYRGER